MITNLCMECGSPCAPRQRFCSDQCFDLWKCGPGPGLTLYPGYSLIAGDAAVLTEKEQGHE